MKLFTIGDSTTHGFMSFAAAKTDVCFSTLIHEVLNPGGNYVIPEWEKGIPIDLEIAFRELDRRFGPDIRGLVEWPKAFASITSMMDDLEDHFERRGGALHKPYKNGTVPYFHNIAVWGFEVADAWLINEQISRKFIQLAADSHKDNWTSLPSDPFHRSAARILNPSGKPEFSTFSSLDWLRYHAENEGVENTILWLGCNNVLGVVTSLTLNRTPNKPNQRPHQMTHEERVEAKWNLWHPDDFHAEYEELIKRVMEAQKDNKFKDWHVTVGNVPFVTVVPLIKGLGEWKPAISDFPNINGKLYAKYYAYFPFELDDLHQGSSSVSKITMQDAIQIDEFIARYNLSINKIINKANQQMGRTCFHVVDLETALAKLAIKRNGGNPTYKLPPTVNDLIPRPNTRFYHATQSGKMESGGIFSLDGVHVSTIGQGIIAKEFLQVMKAAGIPGADETKLDWDRIIESDTLYQRPIRIMSELRENKDLIQWVLNLRHFFDK